MAVEQAWFYISCVIFTFWIITIAGALHLINCYKDDLRVARDRIRQIRLDNKVFHLKE